MPAAAVAVMALRVPRELAAREAAVLAARLAAALADLESLTPAAVVADTAAPAVPAWSLFAILKPMAQPLPLQALQP